MSIHLDGSVSRSAHAQTAAVALEQTPSAQQGIGQDTSTVLSLREHVNADSSSFCSCFTQLINWFKSIFSNFFASSAVQANEPVVTTDRVAPPPQEIQSTNPYFNPYPRERIREQMSHMVDYQFTEESRAGVVYPVDVIVFAKFNGQILSTSFERLYHHQVSPFAVRVKEQLSRQIETMEEGDLVPAPLEVKTCYVVRRTPDLSNPSCQITSLFREFDFSGGTVNGDRRVVNTSLPQDLTQFLHDIAGRDLPQFNAMANFLFPRGVTDPQSGSLVRL